MDAHLLLAAALTANIAALVVVIGKLRSDLREQQKAGYDRRAVGNWRHASGRRDISFFASRNVDHARKG